MDESTKQESAAYLAKLANALDHAVSQLSEVGMLEMRRRVDTTSAIIRSAVPAFHQALTRERDLKHRRESRTPLFLLIGCLGAGGVLHYLFRDPTKLLDFTFGALVATYGLVSYILYALNIERSTRALERYQDRIDELLYRWIANGGSQDRFWQLRSQVNVDSGGIDMDTQTYRVWWYEMKADFVDSINGEVPGLGSWRPRDLGW